MKRTLNLTLLLCVLVFAAFTAVGQDDDHHKVEVFGGYSYLRVDLGIDEDFPDANSSFGAHGFAAHVTGNVNRYVGLQGEFSTHTRRRNFVDGVDTLDLKVRTNQFLGGIQVKDNKKEGSRVRPFFRVLAGLSNQRVNARGTFFDPGGGGEGGGGTTVTFDESESLNNFAMVIGGGVDVTVSPRVAIRLVQADYNPIFVRSQTTSGGFNVDSNTQHNFRIGVGVIFR